MKRKVDWAVNGPKLRAMLGTYSGPQIAEALQVPINSVRNYCQQNGLSLKIPKSTDKPKAPRKVYPRSPVSETLPVLSVDPDKLWKIPPMAARLQSMTNARNLLRRQQ